MYRLIQLIHEAEPQSWPVDHYFHQWCRSVPTIATARIVSLAEAIIADTHAMSCNFM